MTVKEIIEKYLRDNGYDGLCGDDCGCGLDDLAPCDQGFQQCEPGYKCSGKCDGCEVADCCDNSGEKDAQCYMVKKL